MPGDVLAYELDRRLRVIFGVTLMGVMGVSLLSPVFPGIIDHFGITEAQIGLLVTAYTLPGVFAALFIGALADRFGRVRVLTPMLVLYSVAGVAGAAAPDYQTLLALRVLQGVGGAGLVSLAVTLIGDHYDGRKRGWAIGLNGSALSMGAGLFPFIGGLLGTVGWYAPFLFFAVALPIALAALLFVDEPELGEPMDVRSYLRRLGGIAADRDTITATVAGFLAIALIFGALVTFFPVLLEVRFGASPVVIGLFQAFRAVFVAGVSSQTGRLHRRFHPRTLFVVGFVSYGAGMALIPVTPSLPLMVGAMAVSGLGSGLIIPNVQTFMTRLAPAEFRAATMSIYNMTLRLGQTLGPVAFGWVLVTSAAGIDAVFFAAAAISAASFVLLAALSWGPGGTPGPAEA